MTTNELDGATGMTAHARDTLAANNPKRWGLGGSNGLVLEWQRRRKLVPRIREVSDGSRARCRHEGCSKLAVYPDARCALHTAWLDGSPRERLAADAWHEGCGSSGHRRAQAWALWRAREGLAPSGDVFVPLLPEAT